MRPRPIIEVLYIDYTRTTYWYIIQFVLIIYSTKSDNVIQFFNYIKITQRRLVPGNVIPHPIPNSFGIRLPTNPAKSGSKGMIPPCFAALVEFVVRAQRRFVFFLLVVGDFLAGILIFLLLHKTVV
jgi:hypothetical protein